MCVQLSYDRGDGHDEIETEKKESSTVHSFFLQIALTHYVQGSMWRSEDEQSTLLRQETAANTARGGENELNELIRTYELNSRAL